MSIADDLIADAERLEESGDTAGALKTWRQVLGLGPNPEVMARLGRLYTLSGHEDEGEDLLLRSIRDAPDYSDAYFFLGFFYKRVSRLSDAKGYLERGVRLNDWAPAHTMLGYICRDLALTTEAYEHFLRASELDPSDDEAWCGLGLLSLPQEPEAAAAYFRRAIGIDSQNALAHRELGHSLWIRGSLDEAETAIRESITLNGRDAWAHNYLGQVLMRMERYLDAEQELRAAIEIWPDEPLFRCNLGDNLTTQGRMLEAEAQYKAALTSDMSYYLANLRYGQLLERMGHPNRARVYAERAYAAKPSDHRSVELLRRLNEDMSRDERG